MGLLNINIEVYFAFYNKNHFVNATPAQPIAVPAAQDGPKVTHAKNSTFPHVVPLDILSMAAFTHSFHLLRNEEVLFKSEFT